jgi:hypothetical protein
MGSRELGRTSGRIGFLASIVGKLSLASEEGGLETVLVRLIELAGGRVAARSIVIFPQAANRWHAAIALSSDKK